MTETHHPLDTGVVASRKLALARFLEHCQLPNEKTLGFLTPDPDIRLGPMNPTAALEELVKTCGTSTLIDAGVACATDHATLGLALLPALVAEPFLVCHHWLNGEPFDLVMQNGCLCPQHLPIFHLLQDRRTRQLLERNEGRFLVTSSLADCLILRSCHLATTVATGLDSLDLSLLKKFCRAFDVDCDAINPQPFGWQHQPPQGGHGFPPFPHAPGTGTKTEGQEPGVQSSFPGPGTYGPIPPPGHPFQDQSELDDELDDDDLNDETDESDNADDGTLGFTDGQQASLTGDNGCLSVSAPEQPIEARLVFVEWSPGTLSPTRPAGWDKVISQLMEFERHLGLQLSDIGSWQADFRLIEKLDFLCQKKATRLFREALATSSQNNRILGPAGSQQIATTRPNLLDALAALRDVTHGSTLDEQQRWKKLWNNVEQQIDTQLVNPLLQRALVAGDPLTANLLAGAAMISRHFHREVLLSTERSRKCTQQLGTDGLAPITSEQTKHLLALTDSFIKITEAIERCTSPMEITILTSEIRSSPIQHLPP